MPESQDVDEKTLDAKAGSPEVQDAYLQTIQNYRDGVRNLSVALMRHRRLEFNSSSPVYVEVNGQLSDIIVNLEELGEDPVEQRFDIHNILDELNNALDALDQAAILADLNQSEPQLEMLDKIRKCREHLNFAGGLMTLVGS